MCVDYLGLSCIVGTIWNVLEALQRPSLTRNLSVRTPWTSKASGTATKALAQIGSWLQGLEPNMNHAVISGRMKDSSLFSINMHTIIHVIWKHIKIVVHGIVLLCLSKVVAKRSLRKSRSSKHSRGSICNGLCWTHRILQLTCTFNLAKSIYVNYVNVAEVKASLVPVCGTGA